MAVIRIYDGKSFIGEVTEEQIIVTMGGEAAMANEHMKKDFEGLMAFVRSRSSEENGVITADMRELLKGNGLDAAKTTSLFWLAAVMGQKKILNKLSPVTVMKLLPLIAAKTKAAELNKKSMGNDLERLLEFSRTYTDCTKKIAAGEMTADSAAEKLLSGSDESCTGIAERCGFSDSSQFAMLFRRETGITPTGYRKKHRE